MQTRHGIGRYDERQMLSHRLLRIFLASLTMAALLFAIPSEASAASSHAEDHHGCHDGVCITLQSRNGHGAFITFLGGNSAYSLPLTPSRTAVLMGTSPSNATEIDHVNIPPAQGWISSFPKEANRFWNSGTWFCIVNTVWPGKACAEVIA
jgi:hypothetical protein